MISIGPIEKAWKWFEQNYDQVFDKLEIPREGDLDLLFRREAGKRIMMRLKMERAPCGRCMEQSLFMEEMRELMWVAGYKRPVGEDRSSLRNLRSYECLRRVWDVAIAEAMKQARA